MGETERIYNIINQGERENIEFKEYLTESTHLKGPRRENLACQMKYRLENGNGTAIYFIGISDDGDIVGISEVRFEETLKVIKSISSEIGAIILKVEKIKINGKLVGEILLEKRPREMPYEHILVGTAGHVDHGKSTLVGTIITGELDDGAGKTRNYLDLLPHEIMRGLSADISFAVFGFKDSVPIKLKNPLNKNEKARLVENAQKLISFVDTVGHEPWLRTTIRGIVGQHLDYGLLVVAANHGVTHVTKEHLGILLAMDLPVIIALTKIDLVNEEKIKEVEDEVVRTLKMVGKIPFKLRNGSDFYNILKPLSDGHLVPILRTSALTGEGLEIIEKLFAELPKRKSVEDMKKPFLMYIDKIYRVSGVGPVVSGTIRHGTVKKGQEVLIGPDVDGSFVKARVSSVEMHHCSLERANAGDIVGLALKGVDAEFYRRGMVVCDENMDPKPVKSFKADVVVLNHPTKIGKGYEPVLHIETISEAVIMDPISKEYLASGESGEVKMRFKFRPYYIEKGQKLIFREGRSRGIGSVTTILD